MNTGGQNTGSGLYLLIPLMGLVSFLLLYIIAAFMYPGGSYAYPNAEGFSFMNNYWCDLQDILAKNGAVNPARPVAIGAMIVLCVSVALLSVYIPKLFSVHSRNHAVIKYSGVLSCVVGLFIFTDYHDIVISIAAFIGAITFMVIFIEFYKHKEYRLIAFGILCFVVSMVNYVLFLAQVGLGILPMLQKLMFLLCLLWVGYINLLIYRKVKREAQQ